MKPVEGVLVDLVCWRYFVLWEVGRDGKYFRAGSGGEKVNGKIRLVWGRDAEGLYGGLGVFVYC